MENKNNKTYQDYIDSIQNDGSAMAARSFATLEGYDFSLKTTVDELHKIIVSFNSVSLKHISVVKYNIRKWVSFKYSEDVYNYIDGLLNSDELENIKIWNTMSAIQDIRFLSYKRYQQLLRDIDRFEECNPDYYKTLVMAIWEGVYSNDKSVLWNLRGSDIDINTNSVTMRYSDGKTQTIQVSDELINGLIDLSENDMWNRKFVNGYFDIKISGLYPDSVFKLERRSINSTVNFKDAYNSRIRMLTKKYIGNYVRMRNLYISGMVYRMGLQFKEKGIPFNEVFQLNNRIAAANQIIINEFERINADVVMRNFKPMVLSYMDIFMEDWEQV